ncbi:hypothetical protein DDE18_14225 [Nocardioides gansuensis]|uniref:DUF4334 domain-containing protein n=1 Tax=Nocardioides gansuensis TaxID=2138300 RepID=A0A2T8F825_9ACTN|nr:DUF4334 domain-containing protein [Nocardioides gansuensis]PVG81874.1 hypothetical protein DDE18_14225 [Nocardioides gansuensis]
MTATERLAALEPTCTLAAALELFDSLPAVKSTELTGRWRGRELRTGHPLDGLLEASGWWGKQFDGVDDVHPLLFADPSGELFAVDPLRVPIGLTGKLPVSVVARGRAALGVAKHALRTSRPRARLRDLEHRGVVTASMVYDHLPIIDSFRRVDEETMLGAMDQRGEPLPYFFILSRDDGGL